MTLKNDFFAADIYKEKSKGSSKAQFSVDEVFFMLFVKSEFIDVCPYFACTQFVVFAIFSVLLVTGCGEWLLVLGI